TRARCGWSASGAASAVLRRSAGAERAFLGRNRHLAHHLDDVAVRVPDAQLPVRAVAARKDLTHPLELTLGAELACVRLDVAQRAPSQLFSAVGRRCQLGISVPAS